MHESPESLAFLLRVFVLVLVSFSGITLSNRRNLSYVCQRGTHLHTPRIGPDVCLPCTDGVDFMPESLHRERRCTNCTQVRDENLEVLVSPCNITHDAEILCRDEFYRQRARNVKERDICVKCSDCEHVTIPCKGYQDHVCCLPNTEAVLNQHGSYECKEPPIVCGAGEFLSVKTEQCTPCPPGTFMTSNKHNHTNCQLCQTLDDASPYHEIIQHCNRTHPTIFGCQEGFFRNLSLGETSKCERCDECQNLIQKCGKFNNSVCCDLPNMRVDDTGTGLACVTEEKGTTTYSENLVEVPLCGNNERSYYNPTKNIFVCLRYQQTTHVQKEILQMLFHENKTNELDQNDTRLCLVTVLLHALVVVTMVILVIILIFIREIISNIEKKIIRTATTVAIVLCGVDAAVGVICLKKDDYLLYIHVFFSCVSVVTAFGLVKWSLAKLNKFDSFTSSAYKNVDALQQQANTQLAEDVKSPGDDSFYAHDIIPSFESPPNIDRETNSEIRFSGYWINPQDHNTTGERDSLLSIEENTHFDNIDDSNQQNNEVKEQIQSDCTRREQIPRDSYKRLV